MNEKDWEIINKIAKLLAILILFVRVDFDIGERKAYLVVFNVIKSELP